MIEDEEERSKHKVYMKYIVNLKDDERVIGLHCIGRGVDELI
jgi:pyruvate/2-oxoglutarate dehydrogenase complex dihydrolipoamide dehydrogenase (E3) component